MTTPNLSSMPLPLLAVTAGDSAGVGPELILHALNSPTITSQCRLAIYGNLKVLQRVATTSGILLPENLHVTPPGTPVSELPLKGHTLFDYHFQGAATLQPGRISRTCGKHAFQWICDATAAVQRRDAAALVTAPICKEATHLAGIQFAGHTEMLADLTSSPDPCMAFHAPEMMVALATIHEPLSRVPALLSTESILRSIRLLHNASQKLATTQPRIGVLALNPHAGEGGLFGNEENEIISPAIKLAQAEGINASGPLVPDTAFTWLGTTRRRSPFDAYLALYHDQGLIPFKLVAFDTGVNLTLGLPIVRTSPDHGTAFDIAWQGRASPTSFLQAIKLALRLAHH